LKRKSLSVLFTLVLVASFGLVMLMSIGGCPPTPPPTPPTEVWVDDNFSFSTPGWGYDRFAAIQDGIDAVEGSTVHVAAGTYYERITLKDGVEVLGAGADVTTINGSGSGSVVTADGVGSGTRLDGFTITNGSAKRGGGMYNYDSSPRVNHCTFSKNTAYLGSGMCNYHSSPTVTSCTFSGNTAPDDSAGTDGGGGMYNYDSSPTVTICEFSGNSATRGGGMYNRNNSSPTVNHCKFSGNSATHGGGMYNYDSSPTLINCTFSYSSPTLTMCTFSGNTATINGGGMYNENSSPTLTHCTFSGNTANSGGGIDNYRSSPTVTSCTFSKNTATNSGGGIDNYRSSSAVTSCTFSENTATLGGGMHNSNSSPKVTNCTFSKNTAPGCKGHGGGMCNSGSSPTVTNCTFSGNKAYGGGGIGNLFGSSPTVTNCILWGDSFQEIYNYDSSVEVNYCDVEGGYIGTGNIGDDPGDDPLFVDADVGNYHLKPGSPCIDVGNNAALPADIADLDGDSDTAETIPYDFEGDPRILNGTVDMGVDEFKVCIPVVVLPANGSVVPPFGVTLEWSACEGVTSYEVIIATDAALTNVVAGTPVLLNTTSYGPIELDAGAEYYWQVRVLGPSGAYSSEVWSFSVEQVPPVISP
jgi:parallel beta-helix repeat protein